MTAPPPDDPAGGPPKVALPPLAARAARPAGVRLRRGVVVGAAMVASGLLAAALAWAFVVQPDLRARARAQAPEDVVEARGAVRASEVITDQPATYGQLPPPRRLGADGAETPAPTSGPPSDPSPRPSPPAPRPAADAAERARQSGLFVSGGGATAGRAVTREAGDGASGSSLRDRSVAVGDPTIYNPHELSAPLSPYELKAGALIPAVLLTAVDTIRPGPVAATVTDNIFDTVSGRHLVIPQGARLIGRHEGESRYGDQRAFLVWERLILPNGKSLVLTGAPGVDAQGAVGVEGRVDRRLGALATATLFAGAVTTLGQAARDRDRGAGGWWGDAGDAAAIEGARVGGRLIDRELAVRPSVRLKPGARVRVLITRDLVLEPYSR